MIGGAGFRFTLNKREDARLMHHFERFSDDLQQAIIMLEDFQVYFGLG